MVGRGLDVARWGAGGHVDRVSRVHWDGPLRSQGAQAAEARGGARLGWAALCATAVTGDLLCKGNARGSEIELERLLQPLEDAHDAQPGCAVRARRLTGANAVDEVLALDTQGL